MIKYKGNCDSCWQRRIPAHWSSNLLCCSKQPCSRTAMRSINRMESELGRHPKRRNLDGCRIPLYHQWELYLYSCAGLSQKDEKLYATGQLNGAVRSPGNGSLRAVPHDFTPCISYVVRGLSRCSIHTAECETLLKVPSVDRSNTNRDTVSKNHNGGAIYI